MPKSKKLLRVANRQNVKHFPTTGLHRTAEEEWRRKGPAVPLTFQNETARLRAKGNVMHTTCWGTQYEKGEEEKEEEEWMGHRFSDPPPPRPPNSSREVKSLKDHNFFFALLVWININNVRIVLWVAEVEPLSDSLRKKQRHPCLLTPGTKKKNRTVWLFLEKVWRATFRKLCLFKICKWERLVGVTVYSFGLSQD